VTRAGKYLSITKGRLEFLFVQMPRAPIWFGGSSNIAREMAAEHVNLVHGVASGGELGAGLHFRLSPGKARSLNA
jgi:alkanesulfonate monooxygenase SsuD/methylene tetrahydromethanopterin reductase-like flavin-dependent oxidoreductase (luciferase family)